MHLGKHPNIIGFVGWVNELEFLIAGAECGSLQELLELGITLTDEEVSLCF